MDDLFEYWQDYPPTHVLVAAYVLGGGKARGRRGHASKAKTSLNEMKRAVVAAGGEVKKMLPAAYRE